MSLVKNSKETSIWLACIVSFADFADVFLKCLKTAIRASENSTFFTEIGTIPQGLSSLCYRPVLVPGGGALRVKSDIFCLEHCVK